MGILKFIFTFIFFYYAIKVIKSVFFVTKTIHKAKQDHVNAQSRAAGNKRKNDIIEAEYKVVKEE